MEFIRQALDWRGLSGRGAFALASVAILAVAAGAGAFPPLSPAGAGFALYSAVATLVFWGHARRRLRALGWSGQWLWLLLAPIVSLGLMALMILRRAAPDATPGPATRIGFLVVCGAAAVLVSRVLWAPYYIPSASMTPTLQTGDYVIATRNFTAPDRGDVVVFRHPTRSVDFIKRVIGLPGDRVQMQDGLILLNGTQVPQTPRADWIEPNTRSAAGTYPRCATPALRDAPCAKRAATETLPGGITYTVLDIGTVSGDSTPVLEVPAGHLLVLGDNRDNSLDSRTPRHRGGVGFVPLTHVDGTIRLVLYSQEGRTGRFLRMIE